MRPKRAPVGFSQRAKLILVNISKVLGKIRLFNHGSSPGNFTPEDGD